MRVSLVRAALAAVCCPRSRSCRALPARRRAARPAPCCPSRGPGAPRRSTTPIRSTTSSPAWSGSPSRAGRSTAQESGRPRVRPRRHRHLAGPRRRAVAGRPHLPGREGRPVDLHPGLGLQRLDLGEPRALAPARGRRAAGRPARRSGTGHRRRRRTPPSTASPAHPCPRATTPRATRPAACPPRPTRTSRGRRLDVAGECRLGSRRTGRWAGRRCAAGARLDAASHGRCRRGTAPSVEPTATQRCWSADPPVAVPVRMLPWEPTRTPWRRWSPPAAKRWSRATPSG